MKNAELVKELKQSLESINENSSTTAIGEEVRSSVRTINRLNTDRSDLNLQLKKISADLNSLYTNQVQYWELRNKSENPGLKVKPEFDKSFFESLAILKKELFILLNQL